MSSEQALAPPALVQRKRYAGICRAALQVADDLRAVLLLLEAKGTYWSNWSGLNSVQIVSQLQQLMMALDPFQGVPRGSLHR